MTTLRVKHEYESVNPVGERAPLTAARRRRRWLSAILCGGAAAFVGAAVVVSLAALPRNGDGGGGSPVAAAAPSVPHTGEFCAAASDYTKVCPLKRCKPTRLHPTPPRSHPRYARPLNE